ncbi:peptidoglycan-binding protein [Streptomyces tubercidicus]|uniref:peptidoglycan-binding protein n=1 Tax=Streptomyces tubercidicus TaxID=47759 RepID=UPI0033718FFE
MNTSGYVPFPGSEWFKSEPNSPIIKMMAMRLVAEGCTEFGPAGPPSAHPLSGRHWTTYHRDSYAMWQRMLGYQGADADGWPGATSWGKLRVPYSE